MNVTLTISGKLRTHTRIRIDERHALRKPND